MCYAQISSTVYIDIGCWDMNGARKKNKEQCTHKGVMAIYGYGIAKRLRADFLFNRMTTYVEEIHFLKNHIAIHFADSKPVNKLPN